ncbi:MAG TPA: hypothetical protein VK845_04980, partial [Gemmatimonadales bacterium]|nr:hypothetical protein [Gemmatimonadales bacterium]
TAATAELEAVAASIDTAEPGADPDLGLRTEPLLDRVVAPVRAALWMSLVATCLLLVVLATNVAQVQLARATNRDREFALPSWYMRTISSLRVASRVACASIGSFMTVLLRLPSAVAARISR